MRTTEAASVARRARGEESRQRLIDAATALISERGYHATSVNDICRRAGVAKTALYWHFDHKEGLLAAVIDRLGRGWIEELQKRAYLRTLPHERLDELVRGWRELLDEQPELIRLPVVLQLGALDTSEEIREALRALFDRSEAAIRQGLEDSLGEGAFADSDAAAHTVMSLLQALIARVGLARDEAERDALYDELTQGIVHVIWSRLTEDAQNRLAALRGS